MRGIYSCQPSAVNRASGGCASRVRNVKGAEALDESTGVPCANEEEHVREAEC